MEWDMKTNTLKTVQKELRHVLMDWKLQKMFTYRICLCKDELNGWGGNVKQVSKCASGQRKLRGTYMNEKNITFLLPKQFVN
jgi:hypothetical protein